MTGTYEVFSGKSCWLGDIGSENKTASNDYLDCKRKCDSMATCGGFNVMTYNDKCYLKGRECFSLMMTHSDPDTLLYLKEGKPSVSIQC